MENKTANYLKYALGEVILVVIGILIALQINNWNEVRKENLFESKVLSEILRDTEEDLKEMNDALQRLSTEQESVEVIEAQLAGTEPYEDSLSRHFFNVLQLWSLSPNSTAFETAKSEGLHLIKNDSIRFLVAKVNEYTLDYVRVLENRWQDYKNSIVSPHMLPLFESYGVESLSPADYETLKNDATYIKIIRSLSAMRTHYSNVLVLRQKLLFNLNTLLKEELK